jgi:hypothetical protein
VRITAEVEVREICAERMMVPAGERCAGRGLHPGNGELEIRHRKPAFLYNLLDLERPFWSGPGFNAGTRDRAMASPHIPSPFASMRFAMKIPGFKSGAVVLLGFAAGALLPMPAAAQSAQPGWESANWQFAATLYAWVPVIDGRVSYAGDTRSSDLHVSMGDVLSHLKMTFQGAFDAHNGRWGIFTDVVYVDLGGVKSQARDFSIGNIGLPAGTTTSLSLDLKALVWTVAGEYRVMTDPAWTVDLLGGARLLRLKPTLGYSITGNIGPIVLPGRNGSKQVDESVWDGIIGVKGRYAFGSDRKWFVPFYLDVGTGQSKSTWQGAAGIGYAYHWGEVAAVYRYLDYNNKSGKPVQDLNMGGPMMGVTLRW